MFDSVKRIKIQERIDHFAKPLTQAQAQTLHSEVEHDLMLESVTLEDLENTYLLGCDTVPQMMLEAFKSQAARLHQRLKAFGKHLESATPNLSCGEVEVSKPRKSGAVAVQMAKIPLSDGQSISIAFHAPDNDPLVINDDDTLIAFRFLMNSRDVTHVVAPKGNMDLSLKEVTTKLGALLEENSEKFTNAKGKKEADNQALADARSQLEQAEEEAAQLNDKATSLEEQLVQIKRKQSTLQKQIANHNDIQDELRKQLKPKPVVASVVDDSHQYDDEQNKNKLLSLNANNFIKESLYVKDTYSIDIIKAMKQLIAKLIADGTLPKELDFSFKERGLGGAGPIDITLKKFPLSIDLYTNEYVQAYYDNNGKIKDRILERTFKKNNQLYSAELDNLFSYLNAFAEQYNYTSKIADVANHSKFSFYFMVDKELKNQYLLSKKVSINSLQQHDEDHDPNPDSEDGLYWYGNKRAMGGDSHPDGIYKSIDSNRAEEMFPQVAKVDDRLISMGAIAYSRKLTAEELSKYDSLTPFFGQEFEDLLVGVKGNEDQAEVLTEYIFNQLMNKQELSSLTQEHLNKLKDSLLARKTASSAFGKYLQRHDALLNRVDKPREYKVFLASLDLITPEMMQAVAEKLGLLVDEPVPTNLIGSPRFNEGNIIQAGGKIWEKEDKKRIYLNKKIVSALGVDPTGITGKVFFDCHAGNFSGTGQEIIAKLNAALEADKSGNFVPVDNIDSSKADDADIAANSNTKDEDALLALDHSGFIPGAIYKEEKIGDVTVITKRIRDFIKELRKAKKLPKGVKISCKKNHYSSLSVTITDIPDNVLLYNPEYLKRLTEAKNAGINFHKPYDMPIYSREATNLLEFLKKYVDQYNYNNSDAMTDYFDVNFYSSIDFDSSLSGERYDLELESAEVSASEGEGVQVDNTFNATEIMDSLAGYERVNLDKINEHTFFEIKQGTQEIELPSGKFITLTLNNNASFSSALSKLITELDRDLFVLADQKLKPLAKKNLPTTFKDAEGQHGTITTDEIKPFRTVSTITYSNESIKARFKRLSADIAPVTNRGQYQLGLFDKEKFLGAFETQSELESLFAKHFGLIEVDETNEGEPQEMQHVETLKAIRDYTGEPSDQMFDEWEKSIEEAVNFFTSSDTYDENEPLVNAALDTYTKLLTQHANAVMATA